MHSIEHIYSLLDLVDENSLTKILNSRKNYALMLNEISTHLMIENVTQQSSRMQQLVVSFESHFGRKVSYFKRGKDISVMIFPAINEMVI